MRHWLPALSALVCLGLGVGLLGIYGFFVEPLSREFGVGVAIINIGPVALLLVPAFTAPIIGRLADRISIRRIALAGVSCSMLCLCFVSVAPSLWMAGLGFIGFALGLTLYGPVVINGLLVKVYPGNEARALALAAMGISFAGMLLPPLVGGLMIELGWRLALLYLSLALMLTLWLVIWGGIPPTTGISGPTKKGELEPSIYRRPAFWIIGLSVAMGLNVSLVVGICYPPHFVNIGYTVAEAGLFLAMGGLGGLVGKAGIAWLGDAGRGYAPWIAAALLLVQMGGVLLLLVADGAAAIYPAVFMVGCGAGGFIPMHPYLNSRYFDAANIGHVTGAQAPLFLPFGLVGAPLAGLAYDNLGNYQLVLQCLALVLFLAACLVLALPRQSARA